jgi:uncharacterized protein YndB with AHSA1/START domain
MSAASRFQLSSLALLGIVSASLLACAHSYGVPRERGAVRLTTEVEIAASSREVWDLLVDFEGYSQWNEWLPELRGEAVEGGRANGKVWLDGKLRRARHRVLQVDAPRTLCWRDAGVTTWFVWARRCRFVSERSDGTTTLREELTLNGTFVDAAMRRYGDALQRGLESEAESLQRRADGQSLPASGAGSRQGRRL